MVVLVKGELQQLLLTPNIFKLLRLEGCLSGKVPKGAKAIPGPCAELAETDAVEFLTGPATFLNESVVQIEDQLQRLAEHVPAEKFREYLLAVATKYGITSAPSIDNEEFVATVVFDLARPRGTPKARLAYLFPNAHSAQIVIRLKPDLSEFGTTPGDRADRSRGRGNDAAQGLRRRRQGGALLRARTRQLRRLRRPGRDRRRGAGAEGRAARPLRDRARGDGRRALPRLPLALAAAAAGGRADGGGDHLRPARRWSAAR